jgi:hypothetical protein
LTELLNFLYCRCSCGFKLVIFELYHAYVLHATVDIFVA